MAKKPTSKIDYSQVPHLELKAEDYMISGNMLFCVINGTELKKFYNRLNFSTNPRTQSKTSDASKSMRETINLNPSQFLYNNQGVKFTCEHFLVDTNCIYVYFGDFGNIDGHHTLDSVATSHGNLDLVHIELKFIMCNSIEDSIRYASMSNKHKPVANNAIWNMHGRFNWIKESVDKEIRSSISFDGEESGINIKNVLQIASYFDESITFDRSKAYNNKESIAKWYAGDDDGAEKAEKLRYIISDGLYLFETIRYYAYAGNDCTKPWVEHTQTCPKTMTLGNGSKTFRIANGFVFAMINALRTKFITEDNNGYAMFTCDIKTVISQIESLYTLTVSIYEEMCELSESQISMSDIGKNPNFYMKVTEAFNK